MIGQCKCCGESKDLILGFCFDCAECESVLAEGLDMYDNSIPIYDGFSSHMNKLHYILVKFKTPKPPYPPKEKINK
jgi:hypothetical protein